MAKAIGQQTIVSHLGGSHECIVDAAASLDTTLRLIDQVGTELERTGFEVPAPLPAHAKVPTAHSIVLEHLVHAMFAESPMSSNTPSNHKHAIDVAKNMIKALKKRNRQRTQALATRDL